MKFQKRNLKKKLPIIKEISDKKANDFQNSVKNFKNNKKTMSLNTY